MRLNLSPSWERTHTKLMSRYLALKAEQRLLEAVQEDLLLQINSQSDPAWVELILMKGLGLVPEGQTKAVFE